MMSDDEIVKTVAYLKNVVRRKYQNFSHVDDLVDEVSIVVMQVLQRTDTDNPGYRGFLCRGVLFRIRNYWKRYFWDIELGCYKPNATSENVFRNGKSVFDTIHDNTNTEDRRITRIDVRDALERIPERDRDILTMSVVDGEDNRRIAHKYGISRQRASQICISTRMLLSKRLAVYRGNKLAGQCKQCGDPCRKRLPLCDTCRAVNRRETLRNTAARKRQSRQVAA